MTTITKTYAKTTHLVLCGLFAALMAICSFITIPLGFTPVPINLATLGVFLTGGLLGKKYGSITMAVYILMGAVGIPVFSGFRAGLSVIAGPTGGYIIGYLAAVFIVGIILEKYSEKIITCVLAMTLGLIACYFLGTAWFIYVMDTNLAAAMTACVIPFIPGDIIKIILGSILVGRLRPLLYSKIS